LNVASRIGETVLCLRVPKSSQAVTKYFRATADDVRKLARGLPFSFATAAPRVADFALE